jgi:hypothetical protein
MKAALTNAQAAANADFSQLLLDMGEKDPG